MSELPEVSVADSGAAQPAPGPGGMLREVRESRGLTIADVAQALKFSPRQIEGLEADDMTVLPSPVFIRGFVRSYAKFLKLDPVPLVAMLQSEAPVAPPDVREPENMGSAMPKTGVRQIPVLAAASVLLLVAAGVMAAWHFLVPTEAPQAVTVAAAPEAEVAPLAAAAAPATGTDGTDAAVLPPQARVEQPAGAEPVPAAATNATPIPSADTKQLVFGFQGKSWVEVKDASQRIILTGEYLPGSRQAVSGRPPFQLVVGNAAQVDVHYDDRTVDLKPYIRAEVARLTLE